MSKSKSRRVRVLLNRRTAGRGRGRGQDGRTVHFALRPENVDVDVDVDKKKGDEKYTSIYKPWPVGEHTTNEVIDKEHEALRLPSSAPRHDQHERSPGAYFKIHRDDHEYL